MSATLQDFVEGAADLSANGEPIPEFEPTAEEIHETYPPDEGEPTSNGQHREEKKSELSVEELLAIRRFNPELNPPPLRPVYTLLDVPICTPGNLTTFVAAAKAGKTAVLGAMIAAVLKAPATEADTLGFWSENPEGKAVLHFDTEQSIEDHWHVVRRAMRRARVETLPPWIFSYCLTGFNALRAQAAVRVATLAALQECGGVHSVLVDGYADLVADVNDASECNAFVSRLHDCAIEWDCPIVGVLHFNPGTEKGRGHLGSQLERKSETNIRLDKEEGVTELWSEKQRRAPILKGKGPLFAWNDDSQMHVSVEAGQTARQAEEIRLERRKVEEVFAGHPSMRYSDLVSTVKSTLTVSDRTAERRVDKWDKLRLIQKSVAGLWIPTV